MAGGWLPAGSSHHPPCCLRHLGPPTLCLLQWTVGAGYTAADYQVAILLNDKQTGERLRVMVPVLWGGLVLWIALHCAAQAGRIFGRVGAAPGGRTSQTIY